MKNKWSNYALKDGKIKESYIREYSNRKKIRKTGEASNSNSDEQSREIQEVRGLFDTETNGLIYLKPMLNNEIKPTFLDDTWVINLRGKNEGKSTQVDEVETIVKSPKKRVRKAKKE